MSLESNDQVSAARKSPKRRNKEREFLIELKHSFAESGAFWYKIPDSPIFAGMQSRFTDPKPFDAIALYKGIPIAIEAKFIPDFKAFGIKSLRPSQIEGLDKWSTAGGLSYVFLNIRRPADKSAGIKRINRLLIFEYDELKIMEKNYRKKEIENYHGVDGFKKRFDLNLFFAPMDTRLATCNH